MPSFSFSLQFRFEEEDALVWADLNPVISDRAPTPATRESISQKLAAEGYGAYFLLSTQVDELLDAEKELGEQCQQMLTDYLTAKAAQNDAEAVPQKTFTPDEEAESLEFLEKMGMEYPSFSIAERRDGEVHLETDDDDLMAFASFTPPYGGAPANKSELVKAIKKAGMTTGLIKEAIDSAAERYAKDNTPVLIAKGRKPVKGKSSGFEKLVDSIVCSGPTEDDKGKVNYLDIIEFVLVEPGTPLMKRSAPQPGRPGTDVFGRPIPAPQGDKLPFNPNVSGAEVSPDDPNLLIASIKGHPILLENGVTIDPALVLKNVSLATGNIDFDGSVHVKEDVADGMTIKANGEVVVNGVVGKSKIIASGSVIIDQGLIGGIHTEDAKDDQQYGAEIISGGDVSARFVTCAKIEAKGNISVAEYISHSAIKAGDSILLGQERGKGHLIGGDAQAANRVLTKTLGTKGSVPTTIRVGASPDTVPKLRTVMTQMKKIDQEMIAIHDALHTMSNRIKLSGPTEAAQKKVAELDGQQNKLKTERESLSAQEKKLQIQLMKSKAALVSASRMIYTNVWVNILHTGKKITEDMGSGKFRFEARQTIVEK